MSNQEDSPTIVLDLDQTLMQSALLEATQLLQDALRLPHLPVDARLLCRRSLIRLAYFLRHCAEAPRATGFQLSALASHHQALSQALARVPFQEHSLRQAAPDRET